MIRNAAALLDGLLATDSETPFAELQLQFVSAICSRWTVWPPFTRATVLLSVRSWYFKKFSILRPVLSEIINKERDPVIVRQAVNRVFGLPDATPDLLHFLERTKVGGYDEPLFDVAKYLGALAIKRTNLPAKPDPDQVSLLVDGVLDSKWPNQVSQLQFMSGLLFGAMEMVGKGDETTRQETYVQWLDLVFRIVAAWPFKKIELSKETFPLHEICGVLEQEPSVSIRSKLFLQLVPVFVTILQQGELGDYCNLHFYLKNIIAGSTSFFQGHRVRRDGISITPLTEQAFRTLCELSVGRVVVWHQQKATTDDLGWISGLHGEDSVDLIKCCVSLSGNREEFKRLIMPLLDQLAAAGQRQRAADLRIFFRNA